jgi:hypothetical protein
MDGNTNIAVGFFIGLCFMAMAVVALTILYFSNLRVRNPASKGKVEPLQEAKNDKLKNPSRSSDKRQLFRIKRFFQEHKKDSPPPMQPDSKELLVINQPGNSEIGAPKKLETLSAVEDNGKQSLPKEDPSLLIPPPGKPELSAGILPVKEPPAEKANPIPVPADKTPKMQSATSSPAPLIQVTPARETGKSTNVKEVKLEIKTEPPVPAATTVNENKEKSEMENTPKPANSNTAFSELFTDNDLEESEASKLAKELNDIDTQDILEESRALMDQFKKNKS